MREPKTEFDMMVISGWAIAVAAALAFGKIQGGNGRSYLLRSR